MLKHEEQPKSDERYLDTTNVCSLSGASKLGTGGTTAHLLHKIVMLQFFTASHRSKYHKRPYSMCSYSKSIENDTVANTDKQNSEFIPDPSYQAPPHESRFDAPDSYSSFHSYSYIIFIAFGRPSGHKPRREAGMGARLILNIQTNVKLSYLHKDLFHSFLLIL